MTHRFSAQIEQKDEMDAAYVVVPFGILDLYGVGRLKVQTLYDGEPYRGSVAGMEVRDEAENGCHVIGIVKDICQTIGKTFGDSVSVGLPPII